jgi:uncharacterized protein (TIGR03067 family)
MSTPTPNADIDHPQPPILDGWWIARAAALGGVRLPTDTLPALTILLFGRTMYLGSDVGALDLDVGVTPAAIDVLIVRGPNRWRFIPGVFQYNGKRLRLCFDLSGVGRPSGFVAPFGSRHLLVTYERAPVRDGAPLSEEGRVPGQGTEKSPSRPASRYA